MYLHYWPFNKQTGDSNSQFPFGKQVFEKEGPDSVPKKQKYCTSKDIGKLSPKSGTAPTFSFVGGGPQEPTDTGKNI